MLTVLSSVLLMLSTVLGRGSPLSGVRRCDCVWRSKRMQGIYMWLSILPDVAARTKALSRDSNQKEGRACSTPSAFCFSRSSASHDLRPTSRSDQVSRARRARCSPALLKESLQCSFQQSCARPPTAPHHIFAQADHASGADPKSNFDQTSSQADTVKE